MTIERSHGKARPTLPRSSDLVPITVEKPTGDRADGGRFGRGNQVAAGNRWKAAIRKLLGRTGSDEVVDMLTREAWRVYLALLRELPTQGPSVRTLAALQARHTVLAGFFATRAAELGLETTEGTALDDRASKHGQRAERLAVTALDISTKLHAAKPKEEPWRALVKPMPTEPKQ